MSVDFPASHLTPPARYFPVQPEPLRMRPGLMKLGTDFGNGATDGRFFQIDRERDRYLTAKRAVAAQTTWQSDAPSHRDGHHVVSTWMSETLRREYPRLPLEPPRSYAAMAETIQEDFAVVADTGDGADQLVAVAVALPSGWRPENALGRSFREIHDPVPDFAGDDPAAASMVAAMTRRGPYVRFVWSVTPGAELDRHPDRTTLDWGEESPGALRIERQTTIPFPELGWSLFLIRVYVRPFAELSGTERRDLTRALRAMPTAVLRYKGLTPQRVERACALLSTTAQRIPTT